MAQSFVATATLLILAIIWRPVVIAQTCSSNTRPDMLGPFYVPSSPKTLLIGPLSELNNPKKRLEVAGRILSTRNCTKSKYLPLSKINIEVWYAGTPDSQGNYYQTNRYRGQLVTDDCGFYSYVQSFPALYPARPILHTHIRLSDSRNNELLVTQMYFRGSGTGFYNANTIANILGGDRRDLQAVNVRTRADGSRRVRLNMYLNAAGNRKCARFTV
jgi:protocatechuate 3,4-dioxygenase beta subunit